MAGPTQAGTAPAPAQTQGAVPFIDGTYQYSEPLQQFSVTPGAAAQDFQFNITPGGFLRRVTMSVTSTGGVIGTGVLNADSPWSLIQSFTLESIDGGSILYPMGGFAYYLLERQARIWGMAPEQDPFYVNSINPAFRLNFSPEARATLGVLPNTDARAQYRVRFTVAPLANWLSTVGTATAPTLTIQFWMETYAQPPAATLGGAPIAQVPDGIGIQRYCSHQVITGLSTGSNTLQVTRTGNIYRNLIFVFRDSSNNRIDLTTDPIRFRIDNTQMFTEYRARRDFLMDTFSSQENGSIRARPTGVYQIPFFQEPGNMTGEAWRPTTPATFVQLECLGAAAGGSCEIIVEDLATTSVIPAYLENI